jgi:hypothetical protein
LINWFTTPIKILLNGTAEDVLSKVPMLTVDLTATFDAGSQNIRALIDNKPSSIFVSGGFFGKYLLTNQVCRAITAEVKYDGAKETAGIINSNNEENT